MPHGAASDHMRLRPWLAKLCLFLASQKGLAVRLDTGDDVSPEDALRAGLPTMASSYNTAGLLEEDSQPESSLSAGAAALSNGEGEDEATRGAKPAKSCARPCRNSSAGPDPWGIIANDLWGIHDLLLLGYEGVFMEKDTAGWREARDAAVELAKMMPALHPSARCREQLEAATKGIEHDEQQFVSQIAQAAIRCLPGNFSHKDFSVMFKAEDLGDASAAEAAKMPELREEARERLGACRTSRWPRACSYWSSFHLMAYRADALGVSKLFLQTMLRVISGGAVLCGGCTKHFRLLHKDALGETFLQGVGKDF